PRRPWRACAIRGSPTAPGAPATRAPSTGCPWTLPPPWSASGPTPRHCPYTAILARYMKKWTLLLSLPLLAMSAIYDSKLFQEMRWRSIGPLRGGRTKSAAGVAGQPNVFYIGVCNGGVWKTNDYGRTWTPIFDDQPTGSIGAVTVAPSDPNVIYVGS